MVQKGQAMFASTVHLKKIEDLLLSSSQMMTALRIVQPFAGVAHGGLDQHK